MDGEELRIAIDALDDDGRGVGTVGGRRVHVPDALPGELVRARREHDSPHSLDTWAAFVALEGPPSRERVPAACPGHGRCGGCVLQHLAYPAQLTEKRRRVERALAGLDVAIDDVVASPREYEYRNKAKLVIGAAGDKSGLVFGSYAPGTHELVAMAGCQVHEPPIDEIARRVVAACQAARLTAYDERTRAGELRYLVIRRNDEGRVLIVIVVRTRADEAALRTIAASLARERSDVAGVVLSVNATTGGAIFASDRDGVDEDVVLAGTGALSDTIAGIELSLSARAFFQVNRAQAARLYAAVADAAVTRPAARVIELYSGVGGISLVIAARGARVVGVESAGVAVADARRSAAAAGLAERATFERGDAAASLPPAARALGDVDAVVVDPPRKGLSPAALASLLAAAPPRIVYVSCGPESLGRDLRALAGYRIARVTPFDLMPGTPHVETLVVLDRVPG